MTPCYLQGRLQRCGLGWAGDGQQTGQAGAVPGTAATGPQETGPPAAGGSRRTAPPTPGCPSRRDTRQRQEEHHAPHVREVVHRDRHRRAADRGAGQEAPRARGQARQAGPAREGRRYPRSPAPPLTYDPAPVTESRWRMQLICSAAGAQPYTRAGTFCGRLRRGRYRARTSPAAPDPPPGTAGARTVVLTLSAGRCHFGSRLDVTGSSPRPASAPRR
jgi:hypothetical protein